MKPPELFFTVFLQTFDLFQLVRLWWFTVSIITLCWLLFYHQLTYFETTHLYYTHHHLPASSRTALVIGPLREWLAEG